jgi:hypothetical protein
MCFESSEPRCEKPSRPLVKLTVRATRSVVECPKTRDEYLHTLARTKPLETLPGPLIASKSARTSLEGPSKMGSWREQMDY